MIFTLTQSWYHVNWRQNWVRSWQLWHTYCQNRSHIYIDVNYNICEANPPPWCLMLLTMVIVYPNRSRQKYLPSELENHHLFCRTSFRSVKKRNIKILCPVHDYLEEIIDNCSSLCKCKICDSSMCCVNGWLLWDNFIL